MGDNTSGLFLWGASVRRSEWDSDYLVTTTTPIHAGLNGRPVICFNGSSHYLKTPPFALMQPAMVYGLMRQASWVSTRVLFDGYSPASLQCYQSGAEPRVYLSAGTAGVLTDAFTSGEWKIFSAAFNGSGSLAQIGIVSPAIGDTGLTNADGFTLGSNSAGGLWGHLHVAELLIYEGAHDAATRLKVQQYLAKKWGLAL